MSEIKKLLSRSQKARKNQARAKDSFSAKANESSCSFCNRKAKDDLQIIQGSKASICALCVNVCQRLLDRQDKGELP
jgi:hypothetical protein